MEEKLYRNERMTVIIDKNLKIELAKLAKIDNRSLSNYVVKILEDHVNNINK